MTINADTGAPGANGASPPTVTTAAAPPAPGTAPAVPAPPSPGTAPAPGESGQPEPDCVWCDRLPALVILAGAAVGLGIAYDLWSGGKLTGLLAGIFGGLRPPAEDDGEQPPPPEQ